jgi:hypothetical protein
MPGLLKELRGEELQDLLHAEWQAGGLPKWLKRRIIKTQRGSS